MHDFLAVEDAHNHDDTRHGHDDIERGFDQVVQLRLVFQRGGKHGQQHDSEQVGDVVACVEETVGAAVNAGLYALVVQKTLKQDGLDAAVDAHQQDKKGERQALTQYLLEKLKIELKAEALSMAQDDGQSKHEGGNVGHRLGLQVPDDVELFLGEPAAPQDEAHDDNGQHAVEDGEDAVLLEQQQTLYVRPEEEDERDQHLVEPAPEQQLEFQAFVVATEVTYNEDDGSIEQTQ